MNTEATETKTVEGEQVLTLLQQIAQQMQEFNERLDNAGRVVATIGKRVEAMESKPALKPRVLPPTNGHGHNGNGQAQATPPTPPAAQASPGTAAPEETWVRQVTRSRCNMVGITKTRTLEHWKLNMYLPGFRRPATLVAFNGYQEIISLMQEVWPEICEDKFDEGTFAAKNKGRVMPYEELYTGVLFEVDWYRSKPNANGKTYVNVEGVIPIIE